VNTGSARLGKTAMQADKTTSRVSLPRSAMGALLVLLVVLSAAAGPADALAPGPWKLMAAGSKSGRAPTLLVTGRWTYSDEYGPSSGISERWPIPKRMAFVVTETPRQQVRVTWTAMCYPNGERPATTSGSNHGVGTLTIYPTMYQKRVECDPYVVARLAKRGTVSVRIYAY
jgi:hypothetical protein